MYVYTMYSDNTLVCLYVHVYFVHACISCLSLSLPSLQWFFANYLYALALVSKSVALVNTLSSMSSVFVVIMAALPILHQGPGDRITLSRILVTLLRYTAHVQCSMVPVHVILYLMYIALKFSYTDVYITYNNKIVRKTNKNVTNQHKRHQTLP